MMSGLDPTRSLAWPCGWWERPQVAERGLVLRVRHVQGRVELGQELYAAVRTRGQGGKAEPGKAELNRGVQGWPCTRLRTRG